MKTTLAIIGGLLTAAILFIFGCLETRGATPTPSPFDVNAVDVSTISEDQIKATIAHRNALHQQLIDRTLPAASSDVKAAVDKAQDLQKQIDALALQAAKVPILQAELDKAHKAIWRDIVLFTLLGAAIGFLGPKVARLAAFFT